MDDDPVRYVRVYNLKYCGYPEANISYRISLISVKVAPMVSIYLLYINPIHKLYFIKYKDLRISEYIKENQRL